MSCAASAVADVAKTSYEAQVNFVGGLGAGLVDEATSIVTFGAYDPGFNGCAFGGGGVVGTACTVGRITGRVGAEAIAMVGTGGAAEAADAVRAARGIEMLSNLASKARVVAKLRSVETGVSDASGIEHAAEGSGARPAGSIRDVNPTGGTLNCVNCAVGTDATLGGAPASALPGGVSDIGQLERFYGGSFKPVGGQAVIAQLLSDAEPGARGIVHGGRADTYGHVFDGVNQGGVIRFLDGQSGGLANWEDGFDAFYFLRTN